MNSALTTAIQEAFASAPVNVVILDTLEIRQGSVQDPLFLVRSSQNLYAKSEEGEDLVFEPCGFQFTLPPSTEEGFTSLNIAIDNVGKRVTAFIQAALSSKTPVEVVYRPYLSNDLEQPQMNPPLLLFLKDLQITVSQVTARATFMDLVNRKFPGHLYRRANFPALR